MTLPKTICMLPWISLEASPQGTAKPCCLFEDEIKDDEGNKFKLSETSLQDIYKSRYMQTLRQEFRAGAKPEACFRCWREEDAGRTSKRMHSSIRLKELYPDVDWHNDTPDQLWFLDLKIVSKKLQKPCKKLSYRRTTIRFRMSRSLRLC